MEDASFWKAADKTSFLIDGQHPVQNHMVSRLNQWIQDPNNSFRILNSYRFDSNHLIPNVSLAGDFLGSLAPLHLKLHLASKPGGSLTGSLDSINQGAIAYDPALPGSPIYLANTSPRDSRVKPQSRCRTELASVSSMLAQKLLAWMLPSEDRLFIQRFDP
jgi:hypothetical protein